MPAGLFDAFDTCKPSASVQLPWLSVGYGRLLSAFAGSAF